MTEVTPIICFDQYTFKYRTQKEATLQEINLAVRPGEKILIVGPSGSGKSTLGQCLNGLVPASFRGQVQGSLVVDGQNPAIGGIFAMSKKVGTVLQDPDSQFIGLTVGEDIAFSSENDMIAQEAMEEIVYRCAEMVDMADFLEHAPQALSGGQKQRVALAGVMTGQVDILLFDEPLANLDPATGQYAIELIDRLQREVGATVIIIEHRLEDVLYRPVDRIIVMDQGRITADMKPDELLAGDILKKTGIREPLYLTALKYAGCQIQPEARPADVDQVIFDKEKLKEWYRAEAVTKGANQQLPLLSFEQVSFAYQSAEPVLNDVSFTVNRGDMISIVGKNGAGKTTLSKLVCGFIKPTAGRILFEDEDLIDQTIKQRAEKIGLVMQNPNHMISKTMIYDEVALGLVARGIAPDEIQERVNETLKICGLYPFRRWPISALSFGQKKRVTIASILVLQPQILILDEPTAGQDFKHYTEIMEFLRTLNRNHGMTIMMITHDMHLMLEYANRGVVLTEGRLIADTTCADILTDPQIVEQANLKLTSLYHLAERSGITQPIALVQRFIMEDRKERQA